MCLQDIWPFKWWRRNWYNHSPPCKSLIDWRPTQGRRTKTSEQVITHGASVSLNGDLRDFLWSHCLSHCLCWHCWSHTLWLVLLNPDYGNLYGHPENITFVAVAGVTDWIDCRVVRSAQPSDLWERRMIFCYITLNTSLTLNMTLP